MMNGSPHLDDHTLVRQSLSEPGVFGELFDRYFDRVYRFARSRTTAAAAEDIASETFVVAFANRDKFRPAASALPWLIGIAANLLMKASQRSGATERLLRRIAGREPAWTVDDDDHIVVSSSTRTRLIEALSNLGANDRDALLLSVWDGLSYAEIADATGVPIGTVRSRISRARTVLQSALDQGKSRERSHHD